MSLTTTDVKIILQIIVIHGWLLLLSTQAECKSVCDGAPCGRNAECTAVNHQPKCTCKPGYHGNAQLGCQPIECRTNNDCSNDKLCEDYMCKISCLAHNPCGQYSLCSAENHKQVSSRTTK